jgi:hypothetical protein
MRFECVSEATAEVVSGTGSSQPGNIEIGMFKFTSEFFK